MAKLKRATNTFAKLRWRRRRSGCGMLVDGATPSTANRNETSPRPGSAQISDRAG